MHKRHYTCFLGITAAMVSALLPASAVAQPPEIRLLWTANLNTFLESAPTLADLNGDGLDEILAAGREELIALDGTGKELWRWRTKGRFMTYPSVLRRDNGTPLIYVADTAGLLSCVDGAGTLVWQAQLKAGSSWSAAVVCDLNADGVAEVIQTDESGAVWAFDALSGKVIWQAAVKGMPVSPAVSRVDAEGGLPMIVVNTGSGMLTVLKNDGAILWERRVGGSSPSWATAAPVIFGATDRKARILAAASEGRLLCLDAHGNVLWSHPTPGSVASTISVGDLDQDGRPDVFCITQTGVIYRFDQDGRPLWEIDMQGRSLAAGAILDLMHDGRMEYALCTQSGRFLVLNDEGRFIHEHVFENRTINVTPTFGDVAGSSPGLEMVITGGESGRVFCFATSVSKDAAKDWWCYRGPSLSNSYWPAEQTAVSARMDPVNLVWDQLATGDPVRFLIETAAKPGPYKATAACVRPDGSRQAAMSPVASVRTELLLPGDLTLPGTYSFQWSLVTPDNTSVTDGKREISFHPFANDHAILERSLEMLKAAAESTRDVLPLTRSALLAEAASLQTESDALGPLQSTLAGADADETQATVKRSAALVAHARRASRIAEAASRAVFLGSGTSVIAFEAATWENRDIAARVPAQTRNPLSITRRVVPNEHEPVSLNLFNLTDRELQVRALIEPPLPELKAVLHYSQTAPTAQGALAWDPLPECDDTAILTIPSLATREFWLDIQVGACAPGEHHVKVRFQALNGAGVLEGGVNPHDAAPPETAVDIALKVLPFELAPPGSLRSCSWATLGPPEIADLLAHGNNVFCAPLPEPRFDEQGSFSGSDYAKLDALIAMLRGNDVVLLVQGMPGLHGSFSDETYKADLKRFLDDMVQHLAAAGFDTQHFALYPIDEPGGAGWNAVNQLVEFGKRVREVRPDVQIYVNGGGELPMFEAMAPITDIWCPGIYMLAEDSPEMKVIRGTGKQIWSYNCAYGYTTSARSSLKDTNIIAEYRTAAIFAVRHNATGIGFWCYNIGQDAWTRVENDYPIVYPGRTKPVTSRRWEAVREGIEDARILMALRQRLQNATDENMRRRLQHLFESTLPAITDPSLKEMNLGLGRHAIDLTNSEEMVNTFRNEMLDCVEAVSSRN